eukprot:760664-Hanusia_phi.AAC.3
MAPSEIWFTLTLPPPLDIQPRAMEPVQLCRGAFRGRVPLPSQTSHAAAHGTRSRRAGPVRYTPLQNGYENPYSGWVRPRLVEAEPRNSEMALWTPPYEPFPTLPSELINHDYHVTTPGPSRGPAALA